jgi:hypothetical protein
VTGEGAVDASTIKNQYFNFLILFIFNPMVEVPHDGKFTGDNPFSSGNTEVGGKLIKYKYKFCVLMYTLGYSIVCTVC